ncbi:non-ribosomal peptide synthetase [Streptomyces sp. NRRL S-1448]|uniref:non-ribosomal peptide synthetase n=1 Tax=Streptomyces sp. NRRL S-1448 TaxID=1463883 RepID=UPI0004BE947C|nr:non-ribosomal peptide synthetase [Streptomyces sp. NRRL S-1448]
MPFLHDLLTTQARTDGEGIAALLGDESRSENTLTFGQAETGADRVAAGLALLGVRPGDRVGLHLTRSLQLWPALFGLLRAGAVCVPVDPEDPAERRRTILEFSRARVVLTERALMGAPWPPGVRAVAVEDLLHEAAAPLAAPVQLADDALAFIFYTSGSTGVPKGVMLTHRALLSGQQWLQRTFPLERGDRHLLRTTLSITNLVREVFWPMLSGGTAVVVPPGEHKDPDRLVEWLDAGRVTTLMVVPALLSGMLDNPRFASLSSLKYVFCSSDAMPGALPEAFFSVGLPARLFNVYGLTEALYAGYWECRPGVTYDGFVPVGRPAELTPLILDEDLRPVPDGETGELCLTGTGMAEGYDRLPELTQAKFTDSPHGRLFRTGDLGRLAADGRLELLGRLDDQVKIAGYRVELGEVEARLREVPGVTEAVAVGRRGAGGHQRLVAYLTCDGTPPTAADIRARLAGLLPDYMIPAAFTVVDAIPLTHNGKVDRRALADRDGVRLELAEEYHPPRNELERYLCGLWEEVLSLPRVGIHDDFLALGGDSIQGFLISAKANTKGLGLSSTQFFATPTIAETAAVVEERRQDRGDVDGAFVAPPFAVAGEDLEVVRRIAAEPDGIATVHPVTEMQKGMLFHSLLDPDSGVYVEQFLYTLEGELDLDAYHRAWQEVVDRHEILRSWLAVQGLAEPLQVVQRQAALEWTVLDWSSLPEGRQRGLLDAHLAEDRRRDFVYEQAPLFRLAVIRTGADRHRLVMSYHHLILDVWSLFLLLRDSLEIYHARRRGAPPHLPATRPFSDYVAFVRAQDGRASRDYWTGHLAGFEGPTTIGRTARPGLSASPQEMHAGAAYPVGTDLTDRLTAYARAHRLTLNSLIQGAWATVISGLSAQHDVCFGMTITHRPVGLSHIEDMAGIFVNILPMRLILDPARPMAGWLHDVQRTQVTARAHEHYPLPLIQEHPDVPSGRPLFESLLIFENIPHGIGWAGRDGISVRHERNLGWTNYPFTIGVMAEGELTFQAEYDLAHFDRETVDRIMGAFRDVLEAIADGGGEPLGKLLDRVAGCLPPRPAQETAPAATAPQSLPGGSTAPPGTPNEVALAGIWATVLRTGSDTVDVHTPFLELGGSSLAALKVSSLARAQGFSFALRDLFSRKGTVHHLASFRADEEGRSA